MHKNGAVGPRHGKHKQRVRLIKEKNIMQTNTMQYACHGALKYRRIKEFNGKQTEKDEDTAKLRSSIWKHTTTPEKGAKKRRFEGVKVKERKHRLTSKE